MKSQIFPICFKSETKLELSALKFWKQDPRKIELKRLSSDSTEGYYHEPGVVTNRIYQCRA